MGSGKSLGLAAAALFLLGIQMAAPAPAAAQDDPAAAPAAEPSTDRSTYYERRTTARTGNIYGSHGVIGHITPRHGGYYAARRAPRTYAHGSYRRYAGHGYSAPRHYPRYYARHYYPARPLAAPQSYGSATYAPQYYAQRSYPVPAQPLAGSQYYGSATYAPQYYARRSYPVAAQPLAGSQYNGSTGAAFAVNDPVSSLLGTATNWRAGCVNGRICTGGTYYRGSVPICRGWTACNY